MSASDSNSHRPLFMEERKAQILDMLEAQGKVFVPQLCDMFGVSPVTVRNDLRELESEHKLKKTYGGAIARYQTSFEMESIVKAVKNKEAKQRIAAVAAGLVHNGDTIAIDTGTTTLELAKMLAQEEKKGLTIVVNDMVIATYLAEAMTDSTIIIIGGTLRNGFHCVEEPISINLLHNMSVNTTFLATNAFSFERGFSTPRITQAKMKQQIKQLGMETVMLMDHTKIGHNAFAKFADLDEVDKLIVDSGLNRNTEKLFRKASEGTELLLAPE